MGWICWCCDAEFEEPAKDEYYGSGCCGTDGICPECGCCDIETKKEFDKWKDEDDDEDDTFGFDEEDE